MQHKTLHKYEKEKILFVQCKEPTNAHQWAQLVMSVLFTLTYQEQISLHFLSPFHCVRRVLDKKSLILH